MGTDVEQIATMLHALRDPDNRTLEPTIRKILRRNGLSDFQINYFKRYGKMPETGFDYDDFDEFKDEFDKMSDEMDRDFDRLTRQFDDIPSPSVRARRAVRNLMVAAGLLFLIMIALIFAAIPSGDKKAEEKDPPAITETAPVSEGEKL